MDRDRAVLAIAMSHKLIILLYWYTYLFFVVASLCVWTLWSMVVDCNFLWLDNEQTLYTVHCTVTTILDTAINHQPSSSAFLTEVKELVVVRDKTAGKGRG